VNKPFVLAAIASTTLLLSQPGQCSNQVTARVLNLGTYGNGNVFISLDQTIDEPGCSLPYIELPANGPATKATLATAALALATGATVKVQTDGCLNGQPSFTGARPAYFQLNKPQ
jgi:hypothetical protein